MTNIIAAMTRAATTTVMMRFTSFTSFPFLKIPNLSQNTKPFSIYQTGSPLSEVAGCATGSARLLIGAHLYESELLSLYLGCLFSLLRRLYYDRSYLRTRTPGGILLWLLGCYEHVAM
jgi:hypothetical protein